MSVSTSELRRWDADYVWHPFTPHSVYADENPLMIVAAEGHELIDSEGRRYLDGVSSLWCNTFGHRRKEIDLAIRRQLNKVAHATFLGNATAPAVHLAKRLVELTPEPLKRVFFSDNGSTAVEIAIKMAYQFWQQTPGGENRRTFLTFRNAYHGDTLGSVSAGGIDLFHARYGGLLFDTLQAPSPCAYRHDGYTTRRDAEEAAVRAFEVMADDHGDQLAAIIVEPGVQGAAGMLTQPDGFLKRVKIAADKAGALLIFDEVAVGFGRSGDAMFACQSIGVTPDFLCLAKGLTGGYLPLAATLTTERVFQAFLGPPELGRTFFHGHTYTGNPLGAAAAHATLDIFEKTEILAELKNKTKYFRQGLHSLAGHPNVGDIRQFGLCAGIEIVESKESKQGFPAKERIGMRICQACVERGVFLRPLGDVIVLVPPLTLSDAEFDRLFSGLAAAIHAVLGS
ncbi:MAG: adenosylmethionine--8-amino-7-oxononanoate transaminase [Myxococcota bacterium]|nr:adenosylmethionine--8-amino-7-oxononanoate transaminase [Myxococcota bacterium]